MESNIRASIAFIITAYASGKNGTGVFDYTQGRRYSFSGTIRKCSINIFDHGRGCYLTGRIENLYDHARRNFISIHLVNNLFTGYDFDDLTHFRGYTNGDNLIYQEYGVLFGSTYKLF